MHKKKTKNRQGRGPANIDYRTVPTPTGDPDTNDKGTRTSSAPNQRNEPTKPLWRTPPFWQAVFSGCLVLNAGFTIYFLSRQQSNATSAIALTRSNFQQDQRPYVWLTDDMGS